MLIASSQGEVQETYLVLSGNDSVYLLSIQTFNDFVAIKSRDLGLEKIHLYHYSGGRTEVAFPEVVFTASIGVNPEFEQSHLRMDYESMITPQTVYDYNLESASLVTRKVQKIPSGYDKSLYATERLIITARDGAQVPVA